MLANIINPLMTDIISANQIGFVPGRKILDSVTIMEKVLHTAHLFKQPCLFLKLDMEKFHGRLERDFLMAILHVRESMAQHFIGGECPVYHKCSCLGQ